MADPTCPSCGGRGYVLVDLAFEFYEVRACQACSAPRLPRFRAAVRLLEAQALMAARLRKFVKIFV